jgi:hypothetical protein
MVHVYCTKWQYHWYAMPAGLVCMCTLPFGTWYDGTYSIVYSSTIGTIGTNGTIGTVLEYHGTRVPLLQYHVVLEHYCRKR